MQGAQPKDGIERRRGWAAPRTPFRSGNNVEHTGTVELYTQSAHITHTEQSRYTVSDAPNGPGDEDDARTTRRRMLSRIRWGWTSGNIVLALVAIWSFTSDVWEAFITLFLASALLQLLWMKRHLSELQ